MNELHKKQILGGRQMLQFGKNPSTKEFLTWSLKGK